MRTKIAFLATLLIACGYSASALAETRFQNLESLIRDLNFGPYYRHLPNVTPVKIAVLDNGFRGWEKALGHTLPANTEHHAGRVPAPEEETHGLFMAEIVYELLTEGGLNQQYKPVEFHLYNTYGYSNLTAAVDDVIARKIDVVLYAQTWDFGGNFDGRGFVNALVTKATNAGVLWVNAAGNSRGLVHNGSVPAAGKDLLLDLKCQAAPEAECRARVALAWNDFHDETDVGTEKDLDLFLETTAGQVLAKSELRQKLKPVSPADSYYPREILNQPLKAGAYRIRVRQIGGKFTGRDRLRVTVSGDQLHLMDADNEENLGIPADHPGAITVGALDAERSSVSLRRRKPELLTRSLITLKDGAKFQGSSNASALVAAGAAIMRSVKAKISRAEFLQLVSFDELPNTLASTTIGEGLSLRALAFQPLINGCFSRVDPASLPQTKYIQRSLRIGAVPVETTAGVKLVFKRDPIRYLANIRRNRFDDILVLGPAGAGLYPRAIINQLHPELIEIVQLPKGTHLCASAEENEGKKDQGKYFALPDLGALND